MVQQEATIAALRAIKNAELVAALEDCAKIADRPTTATD